MFKVLMVFSVTFWILLYGCVAYLIYDPFANPQEYFGLRLGIGLFMLLMALLSSWDFVRQCRKYDEEE